jgi:hypothetical protein
MKYFAQFLQQFFVISAFAGIVFLIAPQSVRADAADDAYDAMQQAYKAAEEIHDAILEEAEKTKDIAARLETAKNAVSVLENTQNPTEQQKAALLDLENRAKQLGSELEQSKLNVNVLGESFDVQQQTAKDEYAKIPYSESALKGDAGKILTDFTRLKNGTNFNLPFNVGGTEGSGVAKNEALKAADVATNYNAQLAEAAARIKAAEAVMQAIDPNIKFVYLPLEKQFIAQKDTHLPNFLLFIFKVALGIAGLSALVMITIGGVMYVSSAGNQATAGTAKRIITDALVGLIMVFFTWLLLYVINPDLVKITENLESLKKGPEYLEAEKTIMEVAGGTTTGGGAQHEMC